MKRWSRKLKKAGAALLISLAVLTAGASGCAGQKSKELPDETDSSMPKVEVYMPTVYELPDAKLVEDAVNAVTKEKYGIRLGLNFIMSGNWKQQSNLLLTGEEADVITVYDTPLSTYVRDGALADLTEFYAGSSREMKALWEEEELRGTSVAGRLYAIPNFRNFGNYFGLNIDEDIAAEFGIQNGQTLSMEEADRFLRQAHEKYPDKWALVPQARNSIIAEWSWDGLGDTKNIGVLPDRGQTTRVQNLFETEDFREFCTWTRAWYRDGLIMKDILSNMQQWQTLIASGKGIACLDNYGVNQVDGMIRTVILDKWGVSNSYSVLCYGINNNSRDKEAAWKALEILYTDREVSILLNDGLEGRHYEKNSDGTISFPEGKTAKTCGYGMAENYWETPYSANSLPLDVNGPDFFEDLKKFNRDILKSKAFGFSFETKNVADQYAACSRIYDKYYNALMSGTLELEPALEQVNRELGDAGIDEVIQEKQRQLDAYLAEQEGVIEGEAAS